MGKIRDVRVCVNCPLIEEYIAVNDCYKCPHNVGGVTLNRNMLGYIALIGDKAGYVVCGHLTKREEQMKAPEVKPGKMKSKW